jgi:hypothetical protein
MREQEACSPREQLIAPATHGAKRAALYCRYRGYPKARELTITADCGGSNSARVRLWKVCLQKLADETGLALHVHHYPPGTSRGVGRRDCTSGLSQNGA